jgi:hypothetical protein
MPEKLSLRFGYGVSPHARHTPPTDIALAGFLVESIL